jgi:hypothetical protein
LIRRIALDVENVLMLVRLDVSSWINSKTSPSVAISAEANRNALIYVTPTV